MADTSELLRLCDRVIAEGSRVAAYMNYERNTVPDWYKDVAIPSVVLPIARALKSRLQAEAPEDAEVAAIRARHEKSAADIQNNFGAAYSSRIEQDSYSIHEDRAKLLAKLRARTSQAEAQAPTTAAPTGVTPKDIQAAEMADEILAGEPTYYGDPRMHALARAYLACRPTTETTAASVLTDDELERVKFLRRNIGDWTEADAADVCDLVLRVGAPAPAPTPAFKNVKFGEVEYEGDTP